MVSRDEYFFLINRHRLSANDAMLLNIALGWWRKSSNISIFKAMKGWGTVSHLVFSLLYGLWKWNESGFRPPLCTYRLNWARRTSWGWWDDWDDTGPPDTGFEIRALEIWGRARYLSVTEAPHNTDFLSFHYPRAPALWTVDCWRHWLTRTLAL